MTECVILALFVTMIVTVKAIAKQRRTRRREKTTARRLAASKERERQRQAHYMRNFRNYDGSEQEEFE